jgi:hypothetical protein
MTIDDVIVFVSNHVGRQIPTIGGRKHFSVKPKGDSAFIFLTQNNSERNELDSQKPENLK